MLTACISTPPPAQRKCREGEEQKAKMAAHDDDDGNENIAKDEFVAFQTLSIFVKCRQFLLELNPEEKGNSIC